ncbi:MAG: HAMP domain-containing histidine kinase [Clostridia bacterium]|nr:HAMP domain-containing histidine kinase [Clostridia bacterium]
MLFKKVTRRWLVNGLGVVAVLLLILEVVAALVIRSYYYEQTENSLYTRARSFSDMLGAYAEQSPLDFEASARDYMEQFPDKEKIEFQVLSATGEILASSTGFIPESDSLEDYRAAVQTYATQSGEPKGVWVGKNAAGQKVLAITLLVTDNSDTVYGAIRYLVALDRVDSQITLLISIMVAFGLAVIFFVMLSSAYFVGSILQPLTEIGATAKKIAQGDYSCHVEKRHDDEIGELCDTINEMAADIADAGRLQNEFISSISHELRTPLTAIKGWSETLRDESMRDEEILRKGLDVISSEAERLSGMVEDLLDFSRIRQLKPSAQFEKLDVFAEVQEAVFLFRDRAQREGITVQCIEQEKLPAVLGDRARLRQVFVNILDNALKYSRENGTVRVDAATVADSVQVVISDNGIGISKKDLPNVKQKFYRANNHKPGSGIGLAVAEEIINAHHGTLEIESAEGEGTVVIVNLPVHGE